MRKTTHLFYAFLAVCFLCAATANAAGPEEWSAFLKDHADDIAREKANAQGSSNVRAALERLCHQKDCDLSGLYWHTDWEAAQKAAKASGKPILSLRLLGKLDEELSCANSRFFRAALYPDDEISHYLRDQFVLYWESVRPAPEVTLDYGDGRKIKTTLTGNSIHYVLDAEGTVVDALPGLYGPGAFLKHLKKAAEAVAILNGTPSRLKKDILRNYQRSRLNDIRLAWEKDLKKQNKPLRDLPTPPTPVFGRGEGDFPSAAAAGVRTLSKATVEGPFLEKTAFPLPTDLYPGGKDGLVNGGDWVKALAPLHAQDASLDAPSAFLICRKNPRAFPGPCTDVFRDGRADFRNVPIVRNFEQALAQDTVLNEYAFRPVLLKWLIDGEGETSLDDLNEKAYAVLFLTPRSDPWLGLWSPDIFTGLDGNGILR